MSKIIQYGKWIIEVDTSQPIKNSGNMKCDPEVYCAFVESCSALRKEELQFFLDMAVDPRNGIVDWYYYRNNQYLSCDVFYCICGKFINIPEFGGYNNQQYVANNAINIGRLTIDFCLPGVFPVELPFQVTSEMIFVHVHFEQIPCAVELHNPVLVSNKLKPSMGSVNAFEDEMIRLGIHISPIAKKEITPLKRRWLRTFSPNGSVTEKIKNDCLQSVQSTKRVYLWHLFSYEYGDAIEGELASRYYDRTEKSRCMVLLDSHLSAYRLVGAEKLSSQIIRKYAAHDIIVCDDNLRWTYVCTHEGPMIGPFWSESHA